MRTFLYIFGGGCIGYSIGLLRGYAVGRREHRESR